jgi:16S rRNA (guanine(966)-N(2))-methyltransferase RsmD
MYKGRRLESPAWEGLRPTSDRLRETLFNVLAPRVVGARVLDVYAGTGAVGIEALSRGAEQVTFVESDRRAQDLIARNLARCGIAEGYAIIRAPATRAFDMIRRSSFVPFDLALLDPPYDQPSDEVLCGVRGLMAAEGLVVLEHSSRVRVPDECDGLRRSRDLRSGDSALAFYTCQH